MLCRKLMPFLASLGAAIVLSGYSCQAQEVAVTIIGEKQGILKGTAPSQEPNATGAVLSFSYEVDVAIDATSGAAAGKRQTSAIVFSPTAPHQASTPP